MNDKTKYWFDMAEYDIKTAKAMLDTKRLLYVGFMCHLSVEKLLKARICALPGDLIPPKSHVLLTLVDQGELSGNITENHNALFRELQPLHIAGRYTSYKDTIFKTLDVPYCENLLSRVKEFKKWITEFL